MKKTNNSEDIKDDPDELRKKKCTSEVVPDQMVPVPENRPFLQDCEVIKNKNDEKKNNILPFTNKECSDPLEAQDQLFANSMYEDVNSPEDFDDYDDIHNDEGVQESCSTRKIAEDCSNTENGVQENCNVIESIQECFDASESAHNCFDAGESEQNSVDTGKTKQNCCDAGEAVQNSFDGEDTTQDCFDDVQTAQDNFSAGEATQDLGSGDTAKNCFDEVEILKFDEEQECSDAKAPVDDCKGDYEEKKHVVQEKFNISKASSSYDQGSSSENYRADRTEEPFMSEDSSSRLPDDDLTHREMSLEMEAVPTVSSVASMEDDINGDADQQQEEAGEGRGSTEVIKYIFNSEEEGVNETVDPDENFAKAPEARDIIPEVEDVTCDSGGETVLVMKHEVCSDECVVSKPNEFTEEEMIYTDHLNCVQSVDEMIFHKRSTVIDTGGMCASLHVSDNSVMKLGNNSLVCELPQREAAVVRYSEDYGATGVESLFPKRVCNSVCISPVSQPPVRELYVYNPLAQNMTFCRNSTIIDARTLPVNPNLNGLDTYSFHQIPVESSSGMKNINDAYGHSNTGLCPVLQDSRFEFVNRDMMPAKKLPTEDDFMRRIEKTLFESKIETKIDDAEYKAELDLSLPLKKRLRTIAAISSLSHTPEKFDTPKEESFPSYPAKPMISIAELEFTEGLIPKPGTYQDNYK